MKTEVIKVALNEIEQLRNLFLEENNFQFIHNKCHTYGWADTYRFRLDDTVIGYGAIWGQSKREDRDTVFEFYIIQPYRKFAGIFFKELCRVSGAAFIECQSNDPLLSSMLFEHAQHINAEAILFADDFQTDFTLEDVIFEKKIPEANGHPDDRAYILKQDDEVIASGGLMLNYNLPFADVYYEVNEQYRNKGMGSFMVQELKKGAYQMGRVPAARCNIKNAISKATLLKAGFKVCGYILKGDIIH